MTIGNLPPLQAMVGHYLGYKVGDEELQNEEADKHLTPEQVQEKHAARLMGSFMKM